MRLINGCFEPKKRAILQKNRGPTEIILHFFSRFFGFSRFFASQAIAFQRQAAVRPLQKKSYQKHYRRFFVPSGMCHNRRMNVEMTDRNEGCGGWMTHMLRAMILFCIPLPDIPLPNPTWAALRSAISLWLRQKFNPALLPPRTAEVSE
jgi:hypothetical protein